MFDATDALTDNFPVTINAKGLPTVVEASACAIFRFTATGDADPDFGAAGQRFFVPGGPRSAAARLERPDGGMMVAVSSIETRS